MGGTEHLVIQFAEHDMLMLEYTKASVRGFD